MSRYIIKVMYLEKTKRLIIWNGGSAFFLSLQHLQLGLILSCSFVECNNGSLVWLDTCIFNQFSEIKVDKLLPYCCRYNICIWCHKQWEDTHDACERTYNTSSFHIFVFANCLKNTSYLILNLLLLDCVVHNVNSEINIVSS